MGFLSVLGIATVGLGVFYAAFFKYSMLECKMIRESLPILSTPKIVLITGANSGTGYHASLLLAKSKATVVMACRSIEKGEKAKSTILETVPDADIEVMKLDLSSFESIKEFSTLFKEKYDHLDVLINNAGIMAVPTRELTKDGLESQVGTNHFGHFLLTSLLFDHMAEGGKIINHSSGAHFFCPKDFPFEDIQSEVKYDPWEAYGKSKLANVLFTFELNKRLEASGNPKGLTSIAVHPGYTATNLQSGRFPMWEYANGLMAMNGEDGCLSLVLATLNTLEPSINNFFGPKYFIFGAPSVQATSKESQDPKAQQLFWEVSEKVTQGVFGF